MRYLVTGSSGHLGESLVRTLRARDVEVVGIDTGPSPWTTVVGSIGDAPKVRALMEGTDVVLHAATLHKPHVATHTRADFVETNVAGTLALLEAAVEARVGAFVFTSTTSVFGRALTPPPDAPAVWITEDTVPLPRNIYGATKLAAEHVAEEIHHTEGLPVMVLRTSRFFPEPDDRPEVGRRFADDNLKANELLHRRVDLADVVDAHLLAAERAAELGFRRYVVSARTPFEPGGRGEAHQRRACGRRRSLPASTGPLCGTRADGALNARSGLRQLPGDDRTGMVADLRVRDDARGARQRGRLA